MSPPSKTRYLVKKLRAKVPAVNIVVGRWAPASLADEDRVAMLRLSAHDLLCFSSTSGRCQDSESA